MGKHHLPATLTQPPTPEPGLKLVRFWTPEWRCVSNTLVTHWDQNDWRAAFRLWPSHPLVADWDLSDLKLMVTTNEDVPVVWSIDRVSRDCCGWLTVGVISWHQQLERFLMPDWWLLDPEHPVEPPITRYGGDDA